MSVAYGCGTEFAARVTGPLAHGARRRARRSLPGQLICQVRATAHDVWHGVLVEAGAGFLTLASPAAPEPGTALEIVIGASGRGRSVRGVVVQRRRVSSGTFLLTVRVDSAF